MNKGDKIAFVGEDEIAKGAVSVKDMATGEQQTLSQEEGTALIRAGAARRANLTPIREPEQP